METKLVYALNECLFKAELILNSGMPYPICQKKQQPLPH